MSRVSLTFLPSSPTFSLSFLPSSSPLSHPYPHLTPFSSLFLPLLCRATMLRIRKMHVFPAFLIKYIACRRRRNGYSRILFSLFQLFLSELSTVLRTCIVSHPHINNQWPRFVCRSVCDVFLYALHVHIAFITNPFHSFLVACYATLHVAMSVGRSVCGHFVHLLSFQ